MPQTVDIEPIALEELRNSPGAKSIPLVIVLGAAIAAAFVLSSTPLQSANDRSRWCTVASLVDLGTWQIDQMESRENWSTIDKVRHRDHFYSSKPALFQGLIAGVYWCVKQTTGWTLLKHTKEASRAILLIVNLIPVIVAWLLMNGMLVRYARAKYTRRLLLIAIIFSTPITTYLVTLNNHTFAACTLVFALSPALRILIDGQSAAKYFAIAGFFASLTFVNELPALSFLGLLGLLLIRNDSGRTLKFFLPAALIPMLAAIAMTYWQTGGWKPFYAYYGTEKYVYQFEGIPSYWANPRGLDKNADSFPVYLLHCTFGHHGIFSLTPLFLLMLPAWFAPKWSTKGYRPLVAMSLILTTVVLGFYLSRTQNYNYGGNTSTLRWLMWLIPLWILTLIPVLDRLAERRFLHCLAGLFLAVGVFSTYWSIGNPWTPPWMFTLLERQGLLAQYDDPVPPLDRKHYAWFSSLPAKSTPDEPVFVELSGVATGGRVVRIRISDEGRMEGHQTIRVEENLATRDAVTHRLVIDVALFSAGKKIDDWLLEPSVEQPTERERVLTLLRGFPATGAYRPGRVRYVRTTLRTDAFTVRHAALRIPQTIAATGEKHWFRCDTWYSDELPFGVAQIRFSISREDDVPLSDLLLTVSDASSFPTEAAPLAVSSE